MENIFYCLCCKTTFTRDKARVVFKTGFYKAVPLGVCDGCDKQMPEDIRDSYSTMTS